MDNFLKEIFARDKDKELWKYPSC